MSSRGENTCGRGELKLHRRVNNTEDGEVADLNAAGLVLPMTGLEVLRETLVATALSRARACGMRTYGLVRYAAKQNRTREALAEQRHGRSLRASHTAVNGRICLRGTSASAADVSAGSAAAAAAGTAATAMARAMATAVAAGRGEGRREAVAVAAALRPGVAAEEVVEEVVALALAREAIAARGDLGPS